MKTLLSMPGAPESDLPIGLQMGDEQSQAAAIRQHAPRLLAVASRFLKDATERQAAVREAFETAFRSLEVGEAPAPLEAWLRRLTVQACTVVLRARPARNADLTPLLPRFDETGHRLPGQERTAWPSRAFSDTPENRAHARACLDRLPEHYRTPLLLTDIEGFDTAETARLLGLTSEAARQRLHQARQALCTLLLVRTASLPPHPGTC